MLYRNNGGDRSARYVSNAIYLPYTGKPSPFINSVVNVSIMYITLCINQISMAVWICERPIHELK